MVALPSGVKTRVKSIVSFDDEIEQAGPGESVNDHARRRNRSQPRRLLVTADRSLPSVGKDFSATVVWMHADPLDPHKIYLLKHTTRTVRARVKQHSPSRRREHARKRACHAAST